jgi:hypothetical protein
MVGELPHCTPWVTVRPIRCRVRRPWSPTDVRNAGRRGGNQVRRRTMASMSWLPVAPPTSSWKSGPHENTDEYPLPPGRSLISHEGVSIPLLNLIYEYDDCLPGAFMRIINFSDRVAFHQRNLFCRCGVHTSTRTLGGWYGLRSRCVALAYRHPYSDHHPLGNLLALDFGAGPNSRRLKY